MLTYLLTLLGLYRTPTPTTIPAHRWNRAIAGEDLHAYRWCSKASTHDD